MQQQEQFKMITRKNLILYITNIVISLLPLSMASLGQQTASVSSKQVVGNAQNYQFLRPHQPSSGQEQVSIANNNIDQAPLTSLHLTPEAANGGENDNRIDNHYKDIRSKTEGKWLFMNQQLDQLCRHKQIQHLEDRLDRLAVTVSKLKSSFLPINTVDDYEVDDRERDSICKQFECSSATRNLPFGAGEPNYEDQRTRLQANRKSYTLPQPPIVGHARNTHRIHLAQQQTHRRLRRRHADRARNSRSMDNEVVAASSVSESGKELPFRRGLDGVPGVDGAPGLDGIPGRDGRNGRDGVDGRDGRDGKDGSPGERGMPGPMGPPGEQGRRGKSGPPGKMGPAGPPGLCAYQAKTNCSLLNIGQVEKGNESSSVAAILLAPMMIGLSETTASSQSLELNLVERQVTVNEGDDIQLSCEASGQPQPSYIWRRSPPSSSYSFAESKFSPTTQDAKNSSDLGVAFDSTPNAAAFAATTASSSASTSEAATVALSTSTILFDVGANIRISSFAGGQMPLARVDRLQAGGYMCIASNGIPPNAVKRISLDVNYAPTIRLHPPNPQQRVRLGSSHLVECLVEANPSAFTYWMFGSNLMMSVAPSQPQSSSSSSSFYSFATGSKPSEKSSESAGATGDDDSNVTETQDEDNSGAGGGPEANSEASKSNGSDGGHSRDEMSASKSRASGAQSSRRWSPPVANKHIITESTGQLNTGSSYTILTLNITNITEEDLGVYKCVSKNLLAQTIGYFHLVGEANAAAADDDDDAAGAATKSADDSDHDRVKIGSDELASMYKSSVERRLDPFIGWPSYLLDRVNSQYLVFGNEHRQVRRDHLFNDNDERQRQELQRALLLAGHHNVRPFVYATPPTQESVQVGNEVQLESSVNRDIGNRSGVSISVSDTSTIDHTPSTPINSSPGQSNLIDLGGSSSPSLSGDEESLEMCRLESKLHGKTKQLIGRRRVSTVAGFSSTVTTSGGTTSAKNIMLLDQVGKPVYVGNSDDRMTPLSWWSMDTKLSSGSSVSLDLSATSGHNSTMTNVGDLTSAGQSQQEQQLVQQKQKQYYYATMANVTDYLFEYETLQELLGDKSYSSHPSEHVEPGGSGKRHLYKLRHPIFGTSHLIYNGHFIYVSEKVARGGGEDDENNRRDYYGFPLTRLQIVIYKLAMDRYDYIRLDQLVGRHFVGQPLDLGPEYKLDRIELAGDENGVWIIIPTIEQTIPATTHANKWASSNSTMNPQIRRRLHVLKIKSWLVEDYDYNLESDVPSSINDDNSIESSAISSSSSSSSSIPLPSLSQLSQQHKSQYVDKRYNNDNNNSNHLLSRANAELAAASTTTTTTNETNATLIDYHVSMKLDWQMIGQLFVIDGVLYGIKDRHLYSSKLQFAYDLYKCKLLPSQYLNAAHRIFTNHFGNTQMIKYNPNEPKRLYTIDNGNLLWCPVKLIGTDATSFE